MIVFRKLSEENISEIIAWNADRGADFLRQWAGRGYNYPLTEEQISDRISGGAEIFEILRDGVMLGTIELIERNADSALMGRFIIAPTLTGKGIGTEILSSFKQFCKEKFALKRLTLCVFDFNIGAHRCYIKSGFTDVSFSDRPDGARAINMEAVLY